MSDTGRSSAYITTRRLVLSGLLSLTACETVSGKGLRQSNMHKGPLGPLATGTLALLETWPEPKDIINFEMVDQDDGNLSVQDRRNTVTVLYFWTLWLAPAAKELPQLAALQTHFNGHGLSILAVNLDNRDHASEASDMIKAHKPLRFYQASKGIDLATELKFAGLPGALVLDKNGQEIARMDGDMNWFSPDALKFFEAALSLEHQAHS